MSSRSPDDAEWLEADGLGGFASGTVGGIRTRRYHALLVTAVTPPTGRFVLVNGCEAWVDTPAGTFALSTQRYLPDVVHPDGTSRIIAFELEPWPHWTFRLDDDTEIVHEVVAAHGTPAVALSWRLVAPRAGVRLRVRLLLSGRDYHALHHENPAFRFETARRDGALVWTPYPGVPAIVAATNGTYAHRPEWYRRFLYTAERARGLDCTEDLASPGELTFDLGAGEATCVLTAGVDPPAIADVRAAETRRRAAFPSRLHRAADAYLVRRGTGKTIVAGYPWFTDWGRDTFIALRGLCLATGRLDDARDILHAWAGTVSEGMLPNRFADRGDAPEFNAVDASLWFVVAVSELGRATGRVDPAVRDAVAAILTGYAHGTRHGIRLDGDGLLAAGEPGVQLTWMDARIGDRVITPRIGKPVEVNALWLNALHVASGFGEGWTAMLARGRAAFRARFWNADAGCLYDVVDVDHVAGTVDASFRPNQILAVGGLPLAAMDGARARRIVDAVEARLWTPLGLRSLAPDDPRYVGHYAGDPATRDAAYHQGTAWPWLLGPFVEAWLRVRGDTRDARAEARRRFVAPLLRHLDEAGLGHVSEVADAEPPFTPGGCPFQAWSVGEALRLVALTRDG